MRTILRTILLIVAGAAMLPAGAQETKVSAKLDAGKIMVGDQARVFLEVIHNSANGALQWAPIPDTFNTLEVVEKGMIDTSRQGSFVILRQRLLVTGFDSGVYYVPRFQFSVLPPGDSAYLLQTDSLALLVQTVAVDTTKGFKGIKGIIEVKSTWKDYLWWIVGALVLIGITAFVVYFFVKNKKAPEPEAVPVGPRETLEEKYLRLLQELEHKKLWQNSREESVKEYYTELTDLVRVYIEERFRTPMLELTTDEILFKVRTHREMNRHYELLSSILYTADLAKFARAQPTPAEHMGALENARQFVLNTKPEPTTENTQQV